MTALAAPALALPAVLSAQAASAFEQRYNEIVSIAPAGRAADVTGLVLTRDAGIITLERGRLFPLAPVGGRTIGAVFQGTGRFSMTPPEPTESLTVSRFAEAPGMDVELREVVLLFADSTWQQLSRLDFAPASVPSEVGDHARDLVRSLIGERRGTFDPDVLGPLLNGDSSGFFLARVSRARGDPVLFQVNRALAEAVQLFRTASRREWGSAWALVSRFPSRDQTATESRAWVFRERLAVRDYRIEIRIAERFTADLSVTASAQLSLAAEAPVGPWLSFWLDPRLDVDSARWDSGEDALPWKADDDVVLWVRTPQALARGDSLILTVHYRGTMIDRYGDFFFVDPGAAWYPLNRQGDAAGRFDLTFRSPARYPLVCTGERVDSTQEGTVVTTRWVSERPAQAATFNLGLFTTRRIEQPDRPTVDVVLSEEAHGLLARTLMSRGIYLPQQRNMSQSVGADISNALALFGSQYGEPQLRHYTVTEIPYSEGVSFPGVIHLSWGTFQETSLDGFDEFFRAHEVAHQWWGNSVRPATYRDAWLAEGLATYSGLSYLQAARRRNNEYFRFLDRYRTELLSRRDEGGTVWIGYRNSTEAWPTGYHTTVYLKGAWIFHMLRVMMLDLNTLRADRFTEMLGDFYRTYSGERAGTYDFASVVERHFGADMGWFFDQWVRRPGIPTYRVSWNAEPADEGKFRVRLRVRQEGVPPGFRMPVVVAADLGGDRTARFRIQVHGGQTEYLSPLLPSRPRELKFNDFESVLADVRMER